MKSAIFCGMNSLRGLLGAAVIAGLLVLSLSLVQNAEAQSYGSAYDGGASSVCEKYQWEARRMIEDGHVQSWEYFHIRSICSSYSLEALRMIRDHHFYEWEMKHAVQVNNPYALDAFREVLDQSYLEWELRWATAVDNSYALFAFQDITDQHYYEWELMWVTKIHTSSALDAYQRVRRQPTYTEQELQWACTSNHGYWEGPSKGDWHWEKSPGKGPYGQWER